MWKIFYVIVCWYCVGIVLLTYSSSLEDAITAAYSSPRWPSAGNWALSITLLTTSSCSVIKSHSSVASYCFYFISGSSLNSVSYMYKLFQRLCYNKSSFLCIRSVPITILSSFFNSIKSILDSFKSLSLIIFCFSLLLVSLH